MNIKQQIENFKLFGQTKNPHTPTRPNFSFYKLLLFGSCLCFSFVLLCVCVIVCFVLSIFVNLVFSFCFFFGFLVFRK